MNRFGQLLVAAFVVLAFAGTQAAFATTVRKFSVKELTRKSDSIVQGRVESITSSWDAARKEIYTYYTLNVAVGIKGQRAGIVTIRQLGGTVGNVASIVPGMPNFKHGEEVVVFLTQNDAAGYPWVMGLQQGKYSVVEQNGVKLVRNELAGTELLAPNGAHVKPTVAPDMQLNAFLDGIKTDLNASGKIQITPTE